MAIVAQTLTAGSLAFAAASNSGMPIGSPFRANPIAARVRTFGAWVGKCVLQGDDHFLLVPLHQQESRCFATNVASVPQNGLEGWQAHSAGFLKDPKCHARVRLSVFQGKPQYRVSYAFRVYFAQSAHKLD
jgi:hypothetical protein